jgi:serine/threonine protein kinase
MVTLANIRMEYFKKMETHWSFVKLLAKYLGNAIGGGILGDLVTDILPDACKDVWAKWSEEKDEKGKRIELQAMVQISPQAFQREAQQLVEVECTKLSPDLQKRLAGYIGQIPATIIRSQKRPQDPSGKSISAHQPLQSAKDLLAFCPPRISRFQPGGRPFQGVDLELVELLGSGGFGEVWKAKNPFMSNTPLVALKFCFAQEAQKTLRNEAQVLDQIMRGGHHPGIVQLLKTYLSADPPCLEYEFIEGGELSGLIREWHNQQKPSSQDVAALMLELSAIVGYMHRLSPPVVHRDLKPANILLCPKKGGGFTLKVADFGIGGISSSKLLHRESQSSGYFLASAIHGSYTPNYASRQQMSGEPPDTRDDVYALGVIWYQMLRGDLTAGRPGGGSWKKKLLGEGVSDEMLDLLEQCFEDEESERPADAQELAALITKLIGKSHTPVVEAKPALLAPPVPKNVEAKAPMVQLVIEDDEGRTTVIPLPPFREEITIGQKVGNLIRLIEPNISPFHARLIKSQTGYFIEDRDSDNGVKVNGERITGRRLLKEGDVATIGNYKLYFKE